MSALWAGLLACRVASFEAPQPPSPDQLSGIGYVYLHTVAGPRRSFTVFPFHSLRKPKAMRLYARAVIPPASSLVNCFLNTYEISHISLDSS